MSVLININKFQRTKQNSPTLKIINFKIAFKNVKTPDLADFHNSSPSLIQSQFAPLLSSLIHLGKRPSYIKDTLYCNVCQAMVREIIKKIRDSTSEIDIMDAMSDICD